MNSRKDIFTAFREGSEQVRVAPSSRAWQQLEHRLDGQQKQAGKMVYLRWATAIAAAFILVVGLYFVTNLNSATSMAFGNEPHPTQLEDLVNTDGCNPYCLILQERDALPDYYANPVRK